MTSKTSFLPTYILFNKIKILLDIDHLRHLDLCADQVFMSSELRKFPYITISETLILVATTLLRDVLILFTIGEKTVQIPESFAEEV